MLKSILKRALLGFIYGVFIGQTILIMISFFAGDGNFYPVSSYLRAYTNTTIAAVIIQYFLFGIIGVTFASSTIIFEIDKLNLIEQTSLHFFITSIVSFIAGFFCGWFPHTFVSILLWFGFFIFIYVIIWISLLLYYKKKVKEINECLGIKK